MPYISKIRKNGVDYDIKDKTALKIPTSADGTPIYGTAGLYAVSDGAGGIAWVSGGNTGGNTGGDTGGDTGGGNTGGGTTTYGVVWDLINVTSSNPVVAVSAGSSIVATLTADDGYSLGDVTVTMGGEVVTNCWEAETSTVIITRVTGEVIISCSGVEQSGSVTYKAEFYNKSASTPYTFVDNGDGTYTVDETGVPGVANYYAIYKFSKVAAIHNGGTLHFELRSDAYTHYELRFIFVDANMLSKEQPISGGGAANYNGFGSATSPVEGEQRVSEWVYPKGAANQMSRYSFFKKSATIPGVPAGTYPIILVNKLYDSEGTSIGSTKLTPEELQALFSFTLVANVAESPSVAEIVDADYLQDYSVATTSLVTDVEDSTTFEGVLETAKNEWMNAYGGDMNKIPLIIHTDQHGYLSKDQEYGYVFDEISSMVNWYDISKVINLGDTSNDFPNYDNLTAGSTALKNYLDAMSEVPYSKRIEIFGNHDCAYFSGATLTGIMHEQSYLQPYFRNILARKVSNNGYFVVRDDNFNVKYVAISNMEFDEDFPGKNIMSTKQIDWLITEFSKEDGYDVVLLSHMPCKNSYFELTDIESIITARKAKTSGTMTDAYGVEHNFDFSGCDGELLCSLNGHLHEDGSGFTGELAYTMFENFYNTPRCLYFVLVDRANRQLDIWKVESTPQYVNYKIPLDKPTE